MISLIHPSRGRPQKSFETISRWRHTAVNLSYMDIIVSLDADDNQLHKYRDLYKQIDCTITINSNKSAIQAINNGAKKARGNIFVVVSDDTATFDFWDERIIFECGFETDWILKTQDGIQPWIITMPVMDRAYYNRTGNIYDPSFDHMFCDTWLTVQADISGRKITSNLKFPHLNDSIKDELRERTNGTWRQGEETFIRLIKSVPIEDLKKITDVAMKNWIRNKTGIRV